MSYDPDEDNVALAIIAFAILFVVLPVLGAILSEMYWK